jgi:tRNA modification GTPase
MRPEGQQETVAACLTPAGRGAIATLAVHGPEAWNVCRAVFASRSGSLPADPREVKAGQFWLGKAGQELKDDAILTLRRFEPVPWIELHCHGGPQVQAMLLELFERQGVRVLSWRDWQRRTSASDLQAEAAIALAQALTARTASILLDQYHGAFESALDAIRRAVNDGDLQRAENLLGDLLHYAGVGLHLTKPWRVAVAGAANAGKSSLVNALAGFQRCVVSEVPGTTRDVVTTLLAIDGWPVELADTAGLRQAGESLEEEGMRLAKEAAATSDLCLWVVDVSVALPALTRPGSPELLVVNKIDLPAAWDLDSAQDAVRVSARTGEGLEILCAALARRLVPQPPPRGAAVPFTAEWCRRLEEARRHCAAGRRDEARTILEGERGA